DQLPALGVVVLDQRYPPRQRAFVAVQQSRGECLVRRAHGGEQSCQGTHPAGHWELAEREQSCQGTHPAGHWELAEREWPGSETMAHDEPPTRRSRRLARR